MLQWDKPNERYYEHGIDRGVLYLPGKDPIPWNGITAVDEGGAGSVSVLYRDGVIYLADSEASDFVGKVSAMFFPDAFSEIVGIPEVTDGLYVDNQKPKRFNLSYRSLVGNGSSGDVFGYRIHLIYNAVATINPRQRRTIGANIDPVDFTFDISCTPVKMTGYRPSAHYVIDTRFMTASKVAELEGILYGTGSTPGHIPTPDELFELMNYGNAITVTVHDFAEIELPEISVSVKTYTVDGSHSNVYELTDHTFQVDNANAVDNGDGTWTVSDGGNTTVIIE